MLECVAIYYCMPSMMKFENILYQKHYIETGRLNKTQNYQNYQFPYDACITFYLERPKSFLCLSNKLMSILCKIFHTFPFQRLP